MAVSGKRAGVEFEQRIQTPLVNIQESTLPALIIGPLYQMVNAIESDSPNPDAIARNVDGEILLYDGEALTNPSDSDEDLAVYFWDDTVNRTGAQAVQSLIDNSQILPGGDVASDTYLQVFMYVPGTDNIVELRGPGTGPSYDYSLITNVTSDTVGIQLKPGITDALGAVFTSTRPAQILISVRALRRDYTREAIRLSSTDLESFVGDTYGPENPAAFALQNALEAAGSQYVYYIGVDEVTDAYPDGTYEAYVRALSVAGRYEVYSIVVLTYNEAVHNALYSHITAMSSAEGRKERRGFVGRELPTLESPTIISSGLGNLKPIAPVIEHDGVIGEAATAGTAMNGNLFLNVVQVSSGAAATVEYVGRRYIVEDVPFVETTNGSSTVSIGQDHDDTAPTVGDYLRAMITGTSAAIDAAGAAGSYIVDSAGRNFKTLGVTVGTRVDTAAGANRYYVNRVMTTTSVYDTLELVTVSGADLVEGPAVAYEIWLERPLSAVTAPANQTAGTVDITGTDTVVFNTSAPTLEAGITYLLTIGVESAEFDSTDLSGSTLTFDPGTFTNSTGETYVVSGGPYSCVVSGAVFDDDASIAASCDTLEASQYSIKVDIQNSGADAAAIVSLLNSDVDVPSYATFYTDPAAIAGDAVGVLSETAFAGGSNDYRQFFVNTDVSDLDLPASPGSPVGLEKDVYVDFSSENRDFVLGEVRAYNNSVVVLSSSEATADLTGLKTNEAFSFYTLGDTLTITTPLGSEPDLDAQAAALATYPAKFASRRILSIWPDVAIREANGVTTTAAGYHLGATLAGLTSSLRPQQGHTEYPIPGWSGLQHSNTYFEETHLEDLTAAGWWVYVQDEDGAAIVCRKQYTSDTSGDITAEASFTVIADNFSKDVRQSLRPILGVNNITPDIIDRCRLIIQSIGARYLANQAVKSYALNSLTPSTEAGDLTTLVGDVTLEFFGPLNKVRITLNI